MNINTNSKKHPCNEPMITKETRKIIGDFPKFFRGSPFVANKLIATDKEAKRFIKKAYKTKLK